MKKIVRMAVLSAMFFTLLTSCEKELNSGNDNPTNNEGISGDLVSMVNELKEEVAKLNVEVSGLKEENSILKEEIKALKPEETPNAVFEVDGLYFSKDGRVVSPLKKKTYTSGYYLDPEVREFQYDEYGRMKTIIYSNRQSRYTEYAYEYDNMKVTERRAGNDKQLVTVFEY